MKKIGLLSLLLLTFILIACGGSSTQEIEQLPEDQLMTFTLETLAEYDGREGRRAFIAVDGVVYEVTNSPRWPNGNHNGYQAGQDLTEFIDQISPHGRDVLSRLLIVGTLVDE